jgi:hypothetical protein
VVCGACASHPISKSFPFFFLFSGGWCAACSVAWACPYLPLTLNRQTQAVDTRAQSQSRAVCPTREVGEERSEDQQLLVPATSSSILLLLLLETRRALGVCRNCAHARTPCPRPSPKPAWCLASLGLFVASSSEERIDSDASGTAKKMRRARTRIPFWVCASCAVELHTHLPADATLLRRRVPTDKVGVPARSTM